ncbi:transglycosylase SLT domain-containing protein [Lysobacter sp. TY2-98]|uniref:lytic transglycosylase domain-containing protein n=1 Tax=Lysobacter sp. TY2-98 TaxID=2290922 RepID=UPI001F075258|nr:transglycosylase SLT domain-containing protein [Lysobacter sp. TY2-98]
MNTLLIKTSALALATTCALASNTVHAAETRNGREVFEHFRAGLAEPSCPTEPSRWTKQFSHAPERLADSDSDTLVLFSHVVESVRAAHLPSEYALIPFVESGYKPSARSGAGPAGLWQMIGTTARNHDVPMRAGYDGRMSPVDSTKAAVRYLKTLHGMFGGNWRLAVMAYNAGEYRVLGALKRAGQTPRSADPQSLRGLSGITTSYDDKLHAISCVIARAEQQPRFVASLDRPVRALGTIRSSDAMIASTSGPEPAVPVKVASLPAILLPTTDTAIQAPDTSIMPAPAANGPLAGALAFAATTPVATAPAVATTTTATNDRTPGATSSAATPTPIATGAPVVAISNAPRRHTVAVGDNLWIIARRYRVSVADLLSLNGLKAGKLLAPGMVLAVDSLAAK